LDNLLLLGRAQVARIILSDEALVIVLLFTTAKGADDISSICRES